MRVPVSKVRWSSWYALIERVMVKVSSDCPMSHAPMGGGEIGDFSVVSHLECLLFSV